MSEVRSERAGILRRWQRGFAARMARRRRWRAPIGPLLVGASGGLVLIAVASVLLLGFLGITATIAELSREKAAVIANLVEARLRESFDGVRNETRLLADIAQRRRLLPLHDQAFVDLLAGGLAGAPAVTAFDYVGEGGDWLRVTRDSETGITVRRQAADPAAMEALEQGEAGWGPVYWDERLRQPLLHFRLPFEAADGRAGMLVAVVSLAHLSLTFAELQDRFGVVPFILLERQYVLAHPNLVRGFGGTAEQPLPSLEEVGDAVLAGIWEPTSLLDRFRSDRVFGGTGHLRRTGGTTYVYLYREVSRAGDAPWLVGCIMREDGLDAAIDRTLVVAAAGGAVLVLAVVAAAVAARRLSRRFTAFSAVAHRIRGLEVEEVPELPRSRVHEIDETALAMNQMADAMRWFVAYVPRGLVRRLIRLGDSRRLDSENRVLTVMFTDITGFTSLSEEMRADQLAAYLNRHFALLERCVEETDGTVDKILGDGMMVFWGAPDEVNDHARRACAAALQMAEAMAQENPRLEAEGLPPVTLRVGIHTGPVTVGNIGGSARVNYTIVGDTVNTAQRICDRARQFGAPGGTAILVSGETRAAAGGIGRFEPQGAVQLRGQQHLTELYRLLPSAGGVRNFVEKERGIG